MSADNRPPDQEHTTRYASQLFTIRVWQEAADSTEPEWRGRLQHVPSGEVLYFRSWDMLVRHIVSMLPGREGATLHFAADPDLVKEGTARESEPIQGE
jgi:hypothetical protein